MKYSKNSLYQTLIESQYINGESVGPWWYQLLRPWVNNRERVSLEIIESFRAGSAKKVLDIGCGEGFLSCDLAKRGNDVVGLDIARNRLVIAKKKSKMMGLTNIKFIYHDLHRQLIFKDESFDIVICLSVIEYVINPYFVLSEIHRILKKDGILIIEVPNIAYFPERIKLLLGFLPSWPDAPGWQGGRLRAFTLSSLSHALKEQGFTINSTAGVGFLQRIRSFYPSLLSGEIIVVAKK